LQNNYETTQDKKSNVRIMQHWDAFVLSSLLRKNNKYYIFWVYISMFWYISCNAHARRSVDRITMEAKFSAPVQTGPGDHPSSYTMGTGSFPG